MNCRCSMNKYVAIAPDNSLQDGAFLLRILPLGDHFANTSLAGGCLYQTAVPFLNFRSLAHLRLAVPDLPTAYSTRAIGRFKISRAANYTLCCAPAASCRVRIDGAPSLDAAAAGGGDGDEPDPADNLCTEIYLAAGRHALIAEAAAAPPTPAAAPRLLVTYQGPDTGGAAAPLHGSGPAGRLAALRPPAGCARAPRRRIYGELLRGHGVGEAARGVKVKPPPHPTPPHSIYIYAAARLVKMNTP